MARRTFSTLTPSQLQVYKFLRKEGPMADATLVAALPVQASFRGEEVQTPSGLRSRRAELVRKGYVVPHGREAVTQGRAPIRWRAV